MDFRFGTARKKKKKNTGEKRNPKTSDEDLIIIHVLSNAYAHNIIHILHTCIYYRVRVAPNTKTYARVGFSGRILSHAPREHSSDRIACNEWPTPMYNNNISSKCIRCTTTGNRYLLVLIIHALAGKKKNGGKKKLEKNKTKIEFNNNYYKHRIYD